MAPGKEKISSTPKSRRTLGRDTQEARSERSVGVGRFSAAERDGRENGKLERYSFFLEFLSKNSSASHVFSFDVNQSVGGGLRAAVPSSPPCMCISFNLLPTSNFPAPGLCRLYLKEK